LGGFVFLENGKNPPEKVKKFARNAEKSAASRNARGGARRSGTLFWERLPLSLRRSRPLS